MRTRCCLLTAGAALTLAAAVLPTMADQRADALLRQVDTATREVKSLTADLEMAYTDKGKTTTTKGRVKLKRPNLLRVEIDGPNGTVTASDGKTLWKYKKADGVYSKATADEKGSDFSPATTPVGLFFNQDLLIGKLNPKAVTTFQKPQPLAGETFKVVDIFLDRTTGHNVRLYIGEDNLVRQIEAVSTPKATPVYTRITLSNVKVNTDLSDKDFAYTPPSGATLYEPPAPPEDGAEYMTKMFARGDTVPMFDLPLSDGGKVSLEKALKGKKAVLVNFWFRDCPPCRAEFPHLQKMYDELKSKGFDLIAVNGTDTREEINQYLKENKFSFTSAMGSMNGKVEKDMSTEFGVMAYPSNYLLDSTGKVVWRSVGYAPGKTTAALKAALEKLGVK